MRTITRRTFEVKGGQGSNGKRFTFRKRRDPNAMDIDAMSVEKREGLMKAGKCFYCEEHGHMAKDCPKKKGKQAERKDEPPKYDESQKKWKTGKELYAHIRMLSKDLDDEEYKVLMEEAEGSGF